MSLGPTTLDFESGPDLLTPLTSKNMSDQCFPKSARLLKSREFQQVHASQVFAADAVLVVKGCRNGQERTRLGLQVGRKVGNAVVRNRWKRLIREAFRTQQPELPGGLDLVVRPKRGARAGAAEVHRSLRRLANRIEKQLERNLETRRTSDPSR